MLARFHQIIDAVFMKSVVLLVNHDIQLAKDIIVPVSAATPICKIISSSKDLEEQKQ